MHNFIYITLVEKVIFEFDIFFNNLRGHELILKNFWCVSLVIHFNNFIKLSIYEPPPLLNRKVKITCTIKIADILSISLPLCSHAYVF